MAIGRPKRKYEDDDDIGKSKRNREETEVLGNIKIHPLLQQSAASKNETEEVVIKNPLRNSRVNNLNPYLDPELINSGPKRKILLKNDFTVQVGGKFSMKGEEFRERKKEERIERERQSNLAEKGLLPDVKKREALFKKVVLEDVPPYQEWWDEELINEKKEHGNYEEIITSYIQHPVPVEAPWTRLIPQPKPMYLTKKELKRLRKNSRLLKNIELQDKIKLGLAPTPEPKVKLKNLINVLTNESISNPTEVEMRVRKSIEERRLKHEEANENRKLSKDEKRDKIITKNEEALKLGIYRCVFHIKVLRNGKNIYKVDLNAKQLMLSGVCCINVENDVSLVIIEGAHKKVEKYKRLIMNRIDWTVTEGNNAGYSILWEGEVAGKSFFKWTTYRFDNSDEITKFLDKFGIANYWVQAGSLQ